LKNGNFKFLAKKSNKLINRFNSLFELILFAMHLKIAMSLKNVGIKILVKKKVNLLKNSNLGLLFPKKRFTG
jgi:hypothetical protein